MIGFPIRLRDWLPALLAYQWQSLIRWLLWWRK